MKAKLIKPNQNKPPTILTFYCIGDDGVSKHPIYDFLQLPYPQESQEIGIAVKQIAPNQFIEIYDFPTDRLLRNALQLYLNILPNPTLIIYFMNSDSSNKEIQEWVRTLKKTHQFFRVVFVSDVSTYFEREKVIGRVAREFQEKILENICFSTLEPNSISKMLENVDSIGIRLSTAVCLKPTFRERLDENCRKLIHRVKRIFFDRKNEKQPGSVV